MAKLAYYGSRIPGKPHWVETKEGYRIYKDVPICRTGYQEYLGKELKDHRDYKPEWGLEDEKLYKVFRPKSVVTAPETVASFEGKSVLDNHPPDGVKIVTVENESEYGKGHAQNVRVGTEMDDGETPLLADLFVKNEPLNDQVESGKRDISCGYLYRLKKREDGDFEMSQIEGNHIAVVDKGRAGPDVAIQDAAPEQVLSRIRKTPEITERKEKQPMAANKGSIWGRMLKAFAVDAEPDEVEEAAKLASRDADEPEEERRKDEEGSDANRYPDRGRGDKRSKASGYERHSRSKIGSDAEAEEGETGEAEELHPRLAEAVDHIAHMRKAVDAISEHLGVGEKKDDEKEEKEGESAKDADEANVLEMKGDEQGESVLPEQIARDHAPFLKALKKVAANSKDKAITDGYSAFVKALKGVKDTSDTKDPYAELALMGVGDAAVQEDVNPMKFFNGVSYAEGQRRYEEYLAQKGKK